MLSKTSVTSVTTTDQGQIILPERQGAYQRRYLDGIDAFIQDGQENQNAGAEAIEFMRTLHAELKGLFPEAEFKFTGGMAAYTNKHKFFKAHFDNSKATKNGARLALLRHFDDDYKMPVISDLEVRPCRKFGVGKLSSTSNGDQYKILIPDIKSYEINKLALVSIIKKSFEMASDHWEKRLKLDYGKGTLSSAVETINDSDDGAPKLVEAYQKYLDPDYKYHL